MDSPNEITLEGVKYRRIDRLATHVSCFVMYDCHLFRELKGSTIGELVEDWRSECKSPDERYGKPMLCPVTVFADDEQLRRVGEMVFPAYSYRPKDNLDDWLNPVSADPDIARLLSERGQLGKTSEHPK